MRWPTTVGTDSTQGVPPDTDILIVGAGAYGLSSAWWMGRRNTGARIVVVDEGDFAAGGSGRNGAGFRMQWGLELNIRLCQESIRFFETITDQLDYPRGIDLNQNGYLVVAYDQAGLERLRTALDVQHQLGVPSSLLTPSECREMVPALSERGLTGGSFCPQDGNASPFLYLDALLQAVKREGVRVCYNTRIDRLEPDADGYRAYGRFGSLHARSVVLCTDWAVPELLAPLGLDLPITGLPKEALVSAPCPPCVAPVIVSLKHHIAVAQLKRGSVVFTVTRHREPGGDRQSLPDFLAFAGRQLRELVPGLGHLSVLRTWGGSSSVTPDMQPVFGEVGLPGLYVAVSSYRGFMTSPAAGRIMAELVLDGGSNDICATQLSPERFEAGELVYEPLLNQD